MLFMCTMRNRSEKTSWKNVVAVFWECRTFQPEQVGGKVSKWSYEVVGQVLKLLQEPKELYLLFMSQRFLPGSLVSGKNLQGPFTPLFSSPICTLRDRSLRQSRPLATQASV